MCVHFPPHRALRDKVQKLPRMSSLDFENRSAPTQHGDLPQIYFYVS
jgi:hypothetical protein